MAGKEVKFEGTCEAYFMSAYPTTDVKIGDVEVIETLDREFGLPGYNFKQVRVYIGTQKLKGKPAAEGELRAYHGFCGSEVTPADPPEITVGDYDLISKLREYDDQFVLLIVEEVT